MPAVFKKFEVYLKYTTVFLPVLFHGVNSTSKSCHELQKVSEMASWEVKGIHSVIIGNGVE